MKYLKYSLPVLFILTVEILVNFNEKSICLWKIFTGHECWGCGITRAFHALFHLEFVKAFELNHGIIIVAPLLFILWLKLISINDFK